MKRICVDVDGQLETDINELPRQIKLTDHLRAYLERFVIKYKKEKNAIKSAESTA